MAKKLYIVETRKVVTQTWEYQFEVDDDVELNTSAEIMEYMDGKRIEGRWLLDNDEVTEENMMSHRVHPGPRQSRA